VRALDQDRDQHLALVRLDGEVERFVEQGHRDREIGAEVRFVAGDARVVGDCGARAWPRRGAGWDRAV
jgi:hypothetical protein